MSTGRETWLRNCNEESPVLVEASIEGKIPEWLSGSMLRTGPGLKEIGGQKYKHFFDGLAVMSQFRIQNGKVHYRNKFVRGGVYEKVMKAQKIVVRDFGTAAVPDPCHEIHEGRTVEFCNDNGNVNIYPVGDGIYTATETLYPRRIDPDNIDTYERVDINKYIAINTQTAHPHVDEDGTLYNMGSQYGEAAKYIIAKFPRTKTPFDDASIVAEIPVKDPMFPSYYHSFSLTKNYIVFIEQPLAVSLPAILEGSLLGDALQWKADLKSRFIVVSRETGKILPQSYVSPPFAFFHTINAYEENDAIVCDICCYKDGGIVQALYRDKFRDAVQIAASQGREAFVNHPYGKCLLSRVKRFVLPLHESENTVEIPVEPENLTEEGWMNGEFGRINYERHNGLKYRYFYSIGESPDLGTQGLFKVDLETRQTTTWFEKDWTPSEPIFVARPGGEEEDDGVVLSAVVSANEEHKGYLLVLDAKTFNVLAKARFESPSTLTNDFHGIFYAPK